MSTAEIPIQIALDANSNGLRLTPDEFDSVFEYDSNYRYELIDGVVIVNPIPLEAEADPNESLGVLLGIYRRQHPGGTALDLTLPERYIHVPNGRRRADRVIWTGLGRRPNPKTEVRTIAVEFVSAGKRNWERDYQTKRDENLAVIIKEYWIIDRFLRTMTVFRPAEGEHSTVVVQENDRYTTELLPGFELPLNELLTTADKWEDTK